MRARGEGRDDGTGAKRTFVGVAPSKSGTGESTSSSSLSWSTFEAAPQSVRDAQPTPRACPRTSRALPRASMLLFAEDESQESPVGLPTVAGSLRR